MGKQRNSGKIYSPGNSLFPCLLPFHQFSTSMYLFISGRTLELLESSGNKNNKNNGQSRWTFKLSIPKAVYVFAARILEFHLQTPNTKQG